MPAASMEPSALPAPTMLCSSSINRMMLRSFFTSLTTSFIRSSNSPRYLVPATRLPRSRDSRRLPIRVSGTWPSMIRWARPSATALLPTPGAPMRTGLFLVRRERICARRSVSRSRPITGSSFPCLARAVRSRLFFSRVDSSFLAAPPSSSPSWREAASSFSASISQPNTVRMRTATQSSSSSIACHSVSVPTGTWRCCFCPWLRARSSTRFIRGVSSSTLGCSWSGEESWRTASCTASSVTFSGSPCISARALAKRPISRCSVPQ